jgi:hypothetical protein
MILHLMASLLVSLKYFRSRHATFINARNIINELTNVMKLSPS